MTEYESMADDHEIARAESQTVGAGTPDHAPLQAPNVSLLDRQPVRVLGAAQAIAAVATTIIALDVPVWAGLAIGSGLYAIEEIKRLKVTPIAVPRLDDETPLSPSPEP